MKIGVISDTHNNIELIQKALEVFKREKVEMIVHAGDMDMASMLEEFSNVGVPMKMVIGNIDEEPERFLEKAKSLGRDLFLNAFLDFEVDHSAHSGRFYVFHGNVLGKLDDVIDLLVNSEKYDVVIYGHTHVPKQEIRDGVLILNPGSLKPLAVGTPPSVAVYDTELNKARIIEI